MSACPKGGSHDYRKISESGGWITHRCRKCGDTIRRKQGQQHGSQRGWYAGCRCGECREWQHLRMQETRRDLAARAARNPAVVPHGTKGGYANWGCRCDECRAANAAAYAKGSARAAKRGTKDPSLIPHGTSSGYLYWKCRCHICSAAMSLIVGAYRQKRKAAS